MLGIACGDAEQATPTGRDPRATSTSTSHCDDRSDPELDLSAEPDYAVDYLERATKQGCPVRLDVVMLRDPGPEFHCAPWPPEIVFGTTPGTPEGEPHIYARDPEGWLGDPELAAAFDEDALIPPDAVRLPYVIGGAGVSAASDRSAIYLSYGDRIEKWPLNRTGAGCA